MAESPGGDRPYCRWVSTLRVLQFVYRPLQLYQLSPSRSLDMQLGSLGIQAAPYTLLAHQAGIASLECLQACRCLCRYPYYTCNEYLCRLISVVCYTKQHKSDGLMVDCSVHPDNEPIIFQIF